MWLTCKQFMVRKFKRFAPFYLDNVLVSVFLFLYLEMIGPVSFLGKISLITMYVHMHTKNTSKMLLGSYQSVLQDE